MKTIFTAVLLWICCCSLNAQSSMANKRFQVLDSLETYRGISIKNNIVSNNHLIIVDGISMVSEEHLNVCLKDIYANDRTQFGLMDINRAKALRNGNKAGNGIVFVNLDRRAHKRFSRNLKKFRKRGINGIR